MNTATQIANYFIERGLRENNPINPMKLQKVLFYSYGWYWALFNEKLFDEPIQAWKYGPVVESVYHDVKQYGNFLITEPISKFIFGDGDSMFSFKTNTPRVPLNDNPDLEKFLDTMWRVYSRFTAIQLSEATHASDTPWSEIASKLDVTTNRGVKIDDESIRTYFLREKEKMDAAKQHGDKP